MTDLERLFSEVKKLVDRSRIENEERRKRGELFNIFDVLNLATAEVQHHGIRNQNKASLNVYSMVALLPSGYMRIRPAHSSGTSFSILYAFSSCTQFLFVSIL